MSLFSSPRLSARRLSGAAFGAAVLLAAGALPASALGIRLGGTPPTIHVEDCRSAALTRQLSYGMDFSSNTTGPVPVQVAGVLDGSITLCFSLDVNALTAIQTWTETNVTVDGVVGGLLGTADASKVCTAVHLKVAPGVKGTVTATSHAHLSVAGAPPVDWDHTFARQTVVDSIGEDIFLRACADTSGNVTAS